MDSQSFLQEVRDHGLLSEQQLAAAAQKFAPDSPHHDLSAALIDQGWLTPFQAKQIAARQAKSLVLGQYRLLEELGRGGFGCVYKAVHQIMNRIVAVKVISPERVHDERARAWFRREVLATTQLQHPNIVMAYDANEVDGVLFLVMEYVDGPNLSDVVRAQGPLPVGLACTAMYQAARALQYAHERGMVHRDIKPGNLLMPRLAMGAGGDDVSRSKAASQVIVKIVDFGLARLQSLDSSNTLMGLKDKGFVGTPDYVSPEQARSIHEVDIRSDLYSLGCTFFFALTGRPPFRGQNALETVLQHLDEEAPSISALRTEVPQPLVSIFRRLLAKKPAQRFQSPADLVAEMNFFFGSGALAGALEPTPTAMSCLEAGRPRTPTPPLPLGMPGTPRTSSPAPVSPTIKPRDGRREDVSSDPEFVHTTVIPQSQPGRIGSRAPIPADSLTHRNAPAATLDCAPGVAPVSAPVPQPELDWNVEKPRFADAWRHWASVVDDIVQGRPPALTEAEYGAVHAALTNQARCHTRMKDAPALLSAVEGVVAPWLTISTLAATDPQTLLSLWQRLGELENELGLCRPPCRLGQMAMLAIAFLIAGGIGLAWINSGSFTSIMQLTMAHPTLILVLAVPFLALGSMHLYSRLSRS